MTKMRAEAAEAKVVLIEWNTPESISLDTQEALGKWCFETSGNDADIELCRVPANFLGGTISGNLAPTRHRWGWFFGTSQGICSPPPSDKDLLKKAWPERSRSALSTSYPKINERGHICKGSAGGLESKAVGVATVLQATPHGGPHGA